VTQTTISSSFDAMPDEALAALRSHSGPILVDLDETLYLRNSTEDFLDTARPAVLAYFLLKLLELLAPWRWTGGNATRDAWRVRIILLLMPWTILMWRARAGRLGSRWVNKDLLESLQAVDPRHQPTIVTLGFTLIVKPLIAGLGLANPQIIAMNPWRLSERRDGKLALVTKAMGDDFVRRSLLVTDSLDDQKILERCARPLRVIWPMARFRAAFSGHYLPGQYVSKIKHPGERYIYRVILREDYLFWLLASISLASNWLTHMVGLGFLLFSFWTLYEWGYADNDAMGAHHEADPNLSDAYHDGQFKFSTPLAWGWAAVSGVLGLLVLRWPAIPVATDYLAWAAALLAIFSIFWIYNRVDKITRIWLYAILRFLRVGAFVVVVPVSVVGAAALAAYTVSRWVPYLQYRTTGSNWVEDHVHINWLLCFTILGILLGYAVGWQAIITPVAFLFLAMNAYKARYEIANFARQVKRIDR
jgi:hypothetical protein